MDIRTRFGAILRRRRLEAGLSQEELAERAESAAVYISELERGLYNPTLGMIFSLGRALGVHPVELLRDIPSDAETESVGARSRRRKRPKRARR